MFNFEKLKRRDYISSNIFENYYKEAYHLMNMIMAFKKTIQ